MNLEGILFLGSPYSLAFNATFFNDTHPLNML